MPPPPGSPTPPGTRRRRPRGARRRGGERGGERRCVSRSAPEVDDVAEVEDLEVRTEVSELRIEVRETVEVRARGAVVAGEVARFPEEIENILLGRRRLARRFRLGEALQRRLPEIAGLRVTVALEVAEAEVDERDDRVRARAEGLERLERLVHERQALGHLVERDQTVAEVVLADRAPRGREKRGRLARRGV